MTNKEHASKCKTNDINIAAGHAIPRACDCDGYHTFDELYDHRITLFISLCKMIESECITYVWRSKAHSDGSIWKDWFILGINKVEGEQITYHLPLSRWKETYFADTRRKAPKYDGHTPDDVLTRLKQL